MSAAGDVRAVVAGHPLLRAGLAALLRALDTMGAVGIAGDRTEIAGRIREAEANVLIICGGPAELVADIEALSGQNRAIPVLAVSTDGGSAFVRSAFAAGAAGVLTTTAAEADLMDALRAVAAGGSYLHPSLGAALAQVESTRPVDDLSHREREVLRLIALGMTNPEIAQVLVVSTRTVETHRAHLARKLRAQSRADLVQHALRGGLLTVD